MTVDDLYAAPLEDFVAARDALAKELAAAGDSEAAARVKAMRKPSVTAAALNHLTRERPELIETLVDAHRRLRSADSATELRSASEARADAVKAIVGAVPDVSEAVRKKIRSTLLASATDLDAEAALSAGHLEKELESSGLGGFGMATEFTRAGPEEDAGADQAQPTLARRTEHVARLEREAAEAVAEARQLRTDADRAERLASDAEARAARKGADADAARTALDAG